MSDVTRRRFLQSAAGAAAAASARRVKAQVSPPVKTVRTNVLDIGYAEDGDPSGFPVILLHGFPDDAHAYDGVLPVLAKGATEPLLSICEVTDRRGSLTRRCAARPSKLRLAKT